MGGFAHSDGVEALVADGLLASREELEALLAAHRRLSLVAGDAWVVGRAHRSAAERDWASLAAVAVHDLALRPAAAQRRASLALGRSLLRVALTIALPAEAGALEAVAAALGERTPRPTAFGAVAAVLGAGERDAVEAYGYTVLSGMAAAAVRLRVVGAVEAQAALRRALAGGAGPGGEPGFFAPLLEIAAMRHAHLEPRLFAS